MTMNMPPPYQQKPYYIPQAPRGFNNVSSTPTFDPRYGSINRSQQNIRSYQNRSYSPNVLRGQNSFGSYSQTNLQPHYMHHQPLINGSPEISAENFGTQYKNIQGKAKIYENLPRQNNLMRMPQQFHAVNVPPMHQQVYSQQPYQPYQQYPNYYAPQTPYIPPNTIPYPVYGQPIQQNYIPFYTPANYQNFMSNPMRKNLPEKSINSNFNYEDANFDVNYSVEQNLVHCVICNSTYKTTQKRQHLEMHRQRVRNVNIRPVDEQQLKRLQKYNSMIKKGLTIKPIVQPEQFNVQYNPNEFVLRKVTQYKDLDAPFKNNIEIQTEEINKFEFPMVRNSGIQINEPRESRGSSAGRRIQSPARRGSSRRDDIPQVENPRNTNTRFNSESAREEERIFLSDRFDKKQQGQAFNSNYNPDHSFRESERKSNYSQGQYQGQNLGYNKVNNPNQSLRESERKSNYSQGQQYLAQDLGYNKGNFLHEINEAEEYRQSNRRDIPIEKVVQDVNRASQY